MGWDLYAADVPLLAELPAEVRGEIRERSLESGAYLFRRGGRPTSIFVLVEGEIRLVRPSRSGAEIVLQKVMRGFVAEASIDQPAYHCDGIAVRESCVLSVPLKAFRLALEAREFRLAWMANMARELRRLRAQNERLSLRSAEDRIIHFIETEGDGESIELPGTRKEWATELGLTHEALYRTLARLKRTGVMTEEGGRLRLRWK